MEPLGAIQRRAAEEDIPMIVVMDPEVADLENVNAALSSPPVVSRINIDSLAGGYLHDGHIAEDKHGALAEELANILDELLSASDPYR